MEEKEKKAVGILIILAGSAGLAVRIMEEKFSTIPTGRWLINMDSSYFYKKAK